MAKTKNFSFSDFMSFSESLVDSLDAVATKITEVTNQIETLETVLEGDNAADAPADANAEEASAEENVAEVSVEEPAAEESVSEESPVEEEVATEEVVADTPTEEPVAEDVPADESAPIDTPEETPVSEEESEAANDSAAIDAMSTGDENFSDKFMVVGLKNRPWGNRVIAAKDFSEKEHNKLIPTLFSTQAQAQRALTSYNVNGPANFSIRYNHINQMFGMNNTEVKSAESQIVNASEKTETRYDKVKKMFNM